LRSLPHGGLADILDGGTPVVLAPHQDDEVIGCGALLAAAALAGNAPAIVFVTDGSGSHPNSRKFPAEALIALRQGEAFAAAEILGVARSRLHFMGIRDTAAPHDGADFVEAVDCIVNTAAQYRKPVIFAPWAHDPHGDHQAVHKMAREVARALAVRHLSYVVWGWTLPADQVLDPIEVAGWRFLVDDDPGGRKSRALQAYQSQTSGMIDDDPTGFRLDPETLAAMVSDHEVFLVNP
jgi:LmbE family N-acetylglucosaminyl deacetylase